MSKEEQAKIILRELNKFYSVPTYMEKYAIKGIVSGLNEIAAKEEKGCLLYTSPSPRDCS